MSSARGIKEIRPGLPRYPQHPRRSANASDCGLELTALNCAFNSFANLRTRSRKPRTSRRPAPQYLVLPVFRRRQSGHSGPVASSTVPATLPVRRSSRSAVLRMGSICSSNKLAPSSPLPRGSSATPALSEAKRSAACSNFSTWSWSSAARPAAAIAGQTTRGAELHRSAPIRSTAAGADNQLQHAQPAGAATICTFSGFHSKIACRNACQRFSECHMFHALANGVVCTAPCSAAPRLLPAIMAPTEPALLRTSMRSGGTVNSRVEIVVDHFLGLHCLAALAAGEMDACHRLIYMAPESSSRIVENRAFL